MPKRYKISHKTLQDMGLSPEAKMELIKKGVAEPSPNDRRLARVPGSVKNEVSHLLAQAEAVNAKAGTKVVGITIYNKDQENDK
jgi:hypothetical protein